MGNVVFLGVEGSGKTTLAMALAKAFARHAEEGWYLRPEGRGAYNFATVAPNDFVADGFPAQTSSAREMTWTISRDGADMGGMRILDYPGEIYRLAFLVADDEADPDAFRARVAANAEELEVLNRAIDEATDLYVLFNLQDALDLRGDDSNRSAVWVTNECLKRLKALPSKPHVTLVFTQVDRYQTEDDFLHSFTPAELDLIGHDHPDVDWMMVSVLTPPDSEFGIDAFVRRVTGLAAFGVPDGRPRARNASSGSLARLATHFKGREGKGVAPVRPEEETAVSEETESASAQREAPQQPAVPMQPEGTGARHGFLWLVFIAVVVFGAAYFAVTFLQSWGKRRPAASRGENVVSDGQASQVTNVARSGETPLLPVETPLPPVDASPKVVTNLLDLAKCRISMVVTIMPPDGPSLSARAELAAESAAALKAARACATPQEARETLSYAADALGSGEAMYERARADDLLGWGAFVRTRAERDSNPPWTKWLRRIDLLGEKKAGFVQPPPTNSLTFRELSLDGYRAAAARGVPAAIEALTRHASHENRKEVRRAAAANDKGGGEGK